MAAKFDSGDSEKNVCQETCSICLEVFRQPRKLPCHHSFCSVCLHGYLEKCSLSMDIKTFPCPLCRSNIETKQKEGIQIADVVDQFELLSFSNDGSENESRDLEIAAPNCESCARDDVTIPALKFCKDCDENICENCIKYHKKNKLLSSHELKEIEVNETCKYAHTGAKLDIQLKCQRHNMKRFKYICVQHDTLCCSKCVILDHRQCKDISPLEDYAESPLFRNERERVEGDIKKISETTRHLLVHETRVEKMLDEKKIHLADQSKAFKTDILKVLDEELDDFHKKSFSLIKNLTLSSEMNRRRVDSLVCEVDDCKRSLETAVGSKDSSQIVSTVKRIGHVLFQQRKAITECLNVASSDTVECSLTSNLLRATIRNGLKVSASKFPRSDATRFQSIRDNSVICKERFVGKGSCARDGITLDGRYFLCTDERSRIIRVFDITRQAELDYIPLEAEPFGIAALDSRTVAVSMPQNKLISVLQIGTTGSKVTSKQLRQFQTKYGIYGLNSCSINDSTKLIALAKESGCLHMYNMDGTEYKVITLQIPEEEKPLRGWNPLAYANYFTVDDQAKQIFISCQKTSKIMCIDFEGKCKGIFKHRTLQTPLGVKIGYNGYLFVCCYASCRVLVLDKLGNIIDEISDIHGLSGPVSIDFGGDFKRSIVCDDEGEGMLRVIFYIWRVLEGQ